MTHTLAELRTLCKNPDLKPSWRAVLLAGFYLVMVMKNVLGDAADMEKREPDVERRLIAMTKTGVGEMRRIYENKCAALLAELDAKNISHPPSIDIFELLALYVGDIAA